MYPGERRKLLWKSESFRKSEEISRFLEERGGVFIEK